MLSVPELKDCLTYADQLNKGMEMLEDAKKQGLIAALESGYAISELNVVSQINIKIMKSSMNWTKHLSFF